MPINPPSRAQQVTSSSKILCALGRPSTERKLKLGAGRFWSVSKSKRLGGATLELLSI